MKMMKAMKKLKFWSRKKKKKKTFFIEHPPPPPPCHHCHYQYYYPFEPSAPPLPSSSSWVDYDQENQETIYANSEFISFTSSNQDQDQDQDRARVRTYAPFTHTNPMQDPISPQDPSMQADSTTSYQQYMVPNPVYGVPIVPPVRREKRGGAFGCMFAFGAHLFRCFFPCFHIREVEK
ncbi:hypothetical protein ACH5RR_022669 [Cinchona calisaya]|uniref:Uncharacterized protein n=1 Tax=Cinchona calisaya TaxID=153742 RepID=A0ABD2ZBM4_9GENT